MPSRQIRAHLTPYPNIKLQKKKIELIIATNLYELWIIDKERVQLFYFELTTPVRFRDGLFGLNHSFDVFHSESFQFGHCSWVAVRYFRIAFEAFFGLAILFLIFAIHANTLNPAADKYISCMLPIFIFNPNHNSLNTKTTKQSIQWKMWESRRKVGFLLILGLSSWR